MKRHICFGLLAAALLLVSCTDPIDSVLGIDIRVSNMTLTASTERPMTKTTVVSETLVYWEPGDAIAVFSNDTSAKFVADLTAPAATATFRGRLAGWKGNGTLWGVYPYSKEASFDGESITTVLPATQTARAASFGKDINLAIARTDSDVLQFYNVGGGVCFSVTEEGIRKVLFEGLNGETLAGKVKVSFDENGLPVVREVSEGSTFITLAAPEGQTFQKDTWYYLVAIPGALEKGYKMRFYKTDDYAKRISEKSVTIKRSIYGDIQNADEGLEYEPTSLPYPKTVKEWEESDEMTMTISTSVDPILAGYTPGDAQSVEHLVQAVSGLENVASVSASADGSQLLIKQNNGVHVNLILGIQDEPEATSSAAPAPSETPTTKAATETETEAAKPKAKSSAKGNVKATSKDKQVLLLSPFQNDYPKIGPVIDTDYLSSTLNGIGYELVVPSQVTLAHFTGDYLSQYPLVLIASHGAARFTIMDGSVVTSVVNTGIEVGTLDDDADRSALAMAICDGKAQYFITVPWLQATTSESNAFSGSMVYFGSCQSYKDDDFSNFFSSQHAGFLGHQKIMAVQFDNLVMHSLVTSLAMGMNFTHAVESISRDPWAKAEQTKLTSIIHWLFDYTSSDPFPSSFSWKVDPSKLRKVDSNLRLIDAKPINLKHPLSGNRAKLTWDLPHENGEFTFKVHLNGMVYDVGTSKEYTTDSLLPGNYTWFVEASLIYQGEVVETFRSKEDKFALGGGGHASEAVDLGLSVKWASANIGATSSSDPGYYFAWGETIPNKSDYSWETYGFGPSNGLTRYNGNDGLRILLPENDVVHQVYGGNWRMPTVEEWDELRRDCTWEEVKDDDILLGYKVTSKTNDNYIFLPVSGYRAGSELKNPGQARYWYGSITNGNGLWKARNLNEGDYYENGWAKGDDRYLGMPVRGVYDDSASGISSSSVVDLGLSVKWAGTNVGASAAEELGYYYAWGSISQVTSFDWENYPWGQRYTSLDKYNGVDNLSCLKREDDIAYQSLGGPYYRMPTKAEMDELVNNCTWIPATLNGQRGYKIQSKINDNSIFLPIYGYMDGTQLRDGMRPRYWSSSITNGNGLWKARNLNEGDYYENGWAKGDDRRFGMPVRAVYDDAATEYNLSSGDFVDMGLSVDWASSNMGTSLPEEIGNYYAWGEIRHKSSFTWDNYSLCNNGSYKSLNKYNSEDGLKRLDREDDVVFRRYGGQYRTPTKEEWDELWNNCDSKLCRINSRWGYLLTSRINTNRIFIPLSGYKNGNSLRDGMRPRYWSSSITNGNGLWKARNVNEGDYYENGWAKGDDRFLGMPVRAIRAKYEKTVTSGEMIDLGLKIKWASCNVGATVPEDFGNYYAWGEISTKTSFTWDNYKHCNEGSYKSLSKYNSTDGRRYLDWNDDVVHSINGGSWRMPTKGDWEELQNNCDWELTTLNSIRGYRIVSKTNGNSIFLPISGYKNGTQRKDGMKPRYWCLDITNGNGLWKARDLNEGEYYENGWAKGDDRFLGMPVRGVYDDSATNLTSGETIDMGLSVEWAASNIGASHPEEFGKYFGWGETTTHSDYSWDSYVFCENGSYKNMTKYNGQDNLRRLEDTDDVAQHYTSGFLRMPTIDEWNELKNNSTWVLKFRNGHIGYLVTSNINGNKMFLPVAGYISGAQLRDGMRTRYWSSSHTNGNGLWKARNLNEGDYYENGWAKGDDRYLGMPVRGVVDSQNGPGVAVTGVSLDKTQLELNLRGMAQLIATVTPSDATNPSVTWASNRESVATVSADGLVTAVSEGTATITVTTVAGGFTAKCTVTVSDSDIHVTGVTLDKSEMSLSVGCGGLLIPMVTPVDAANDTVTWQSSNPNAVRISAGGRVFAISPGVSTITATTVDGNFSVTCQVSVDSKKPFESKDLGLSVQWATFNVGACCPSDYGEYFAWAETEPKDAYRWNNYKWGDAFSGSLTKYATSYTDKLDNEDDVARVYWGDGWRMPTMSEQQELIDECDWVWTREGLVYGYRVTSRKPGYTDQSIFLPASGYMEGDELQEPMSAGRYWASTLFFGQPAQAYLTSFSSSGKLSTMQNRCVGMTVRPVCKAAPVTGITLDKPELTLQEGETEQLTATVMPFNAGNRTVTWKSNSESVATVSSDGLVTAISAGNATITAITAEGGFTATCSVKVNPYESSDYSVDGIVHTIQKATSGNGINIVLMGDAFSDRLIADGTYERMMKKAADSFFSEEPYHSFRHLFNVYYVDVVSKNEIYNGETALGTSYGQGTEVNGNHDLVASYALNVLTPSQMNKSVIVVLMNRDYYAGTCYYWDDGADEGDYGIGTAIAYFPTNSDDNIFTVLISHEAGGHGFGKLADEYVNYGFEKTTVPQDKINYTKEVAPYGWRKNVDFTSDVNSVKWHQFIADERYNSEEISTYEGGLTYGKGVWHPTKHSIMNDNTGGFNAPSRYAIWYRIHKQAYGEDWQGTYEDFVQYDKVNQTPAAFARRKQQIEQAAKHPLPHLAPPVLITKD
ncbi:MAG: Ig-like domain-containing protein [Bacteroidales bacterium]|nr:Ig-like domain-containing protein [Bacteroidales bacterium]